MQIEQMQKICQAPGKTNRAGAFLPHDLRHPLLRRTGFLLPIIQFHADNPAGEPAPIFFSIVRQRLTHVAETQVQQRNVKIHN